MKACPFCKWESEQEKSPGLGKISSYVGSVLGWYVECQNCEARGPFCETKEEAEERWDIGGTRP